MSDRDHELSAEICRQAARPVLRQLHQAVVPKPSDAEERQPADRPEPVARPAERLWLDSPYVALWLQLPR